MFTPSKAIVAVDADAAVFDITMFVTTAVVEDGTVYKVVLDVVAAVRASTLVVVAISYYLSIRVRPLG